VNTKSVLNALAMVSIVSMSGAAWGQVDPDGSLTGPALSGGEEILEAGDGSFVRNRSQWVSLAGRVDLADNFESVPNDAEFRSGWVELRGGWSVKQVGVTTLMNFRNLIDTPPFDFVDHGGTTHLSCWTDYPEIGETGITIAFDYERPLQGWGAEFWGAASGEKLDIEFLDAQGLPIALMGATKNSSLDHEFIGFIAPSGTEIRWVRFKSRLRRMGTGGEGFGVDSMLAIYADSGRSCYADCDSGSGPEVLDIFDFLCYQNRFAAQDPWACDCDDSSGPGVCDILDFLCYQNAFSAGCP
jgi:hypothetical protein